MANDAPPAGQSEETFLRALVQAAPVAIAVTDEAGVVQEWNARAEHVFGWPRADALGTDLARVLPAPDPSAGAQGVARFGLAAGAPTRREGRRRDGTAVELEVTVVRAPDAGGRALGWFMTPVAGGGDVAGQIAQLERKLAESAAQIESSNRELETFSYSVSHDLRAPLRHIDGFASMLESDAGGALDEQSKRYLSVIVNAAKKMGRLIDDLLTYSRTGRAEMTLGRVNVAEIVQHVRMQVLPTIGSRVVQWDVRDLPEVTGDWALLTRVFTSLVENAVKYTRPRAEARIEIGTQAVNGGEAVIYVRDNGVGFNPKYADRLFGVFQRLHADAEFEGSGMGLANALRIVRRHGGRLWAESQLDAGATFYVALPVAKPADGSG